MRDRPDERPIPGDDDAFDPEALFALDVEVKAAEAELKASFVVLDASAASVCEKQERL